MVASDEAALALRPELGDVAQGIAGVREKLAKERPIRLVLMQVLEVAERLVRTVCARAALSPTPESTDDALRALAEAGVVPEAVTTGLQTVCILGNHARRGTRGVPLTSSDAEDMLDLLLQGVEWYYCRSELGPRLASVYAEKAKSEGEEAAEALELLMTNPQFRDRQFWLTVEPAVVIVMSEAMEEAVRAYKKVRLTELEAELAALRGDG